ncbi:MAG: hypothetical protein ABI895_29225 [Deltaproteobacteria bacterium]
MMKAVSKTKTKVESCRAMQRIYARREPVVGPDFLVHDACGAVALSAPFSRRCEQGFTDMTSALKSLGAKTEDYTLVNDQGPLLSYYVTVAGDQETPYGPLHSDLSAQRHGHELSLKIRRENGGFLPFRPLIIMPSGSIEEPRVRSHLGPQIESVFRVRPEAQTAIGTRPSFIFETPTGGAATWTGKADPREEYWESFELMLLSLGLQRSDLELEREHGLLPYSIVRPVKEGFGVVVEPYFSLAHAARVSVRIAGEYEAFCGVYNPERPFQAFDPTISRGDVVRITHDSIDTFFAKLTWNRVTLEPDQHLSCMERPQDELFPRASFGHTQ